MRYTFLVLLVMLVGCDSPAAPSEAVEYSAPDAYHRWWSELESAAGVRRSMDGVRWFEVRSGFWISDHCGCEVSGLWFPDDRIYIAGGYTMLRPLVMHEMLHALLQTRSHDHPLFRAAF